MAVIETLKDKAEILKGKAGVVLASVGDLNKFTIDKIEQASKLNLSSASYFSDASIKQMRAVTSIRDIDSLRKFTADSISLSGELAKKILDDSKAWLTIGSDIKTKITENFGAKEEIIAKKKVSPKAA
jgi:phasin family protein